MDAAQFVEFWRFQGHRVIETKSCYWYNAGPLFFMSLPYHRVVTPCRWELAHVMLGGPSVAVRFPAVLDGSGKKGGLFICTDRNYDLAVLHPKSRNQTRRGLENCSVERVDFTYLAQHGYVMNAETLLRQRRNPQAINEQVWRRYCKAASEFPGFEAWGAFVNCRLAAFMVTALVEDCFSIIHQSSATDYLRYYPNNALIFSVTKLKLSSQDVAYVSYGLKSLDNTVGLDHFKLRMGFELKPFMDCVMFNPFLKPFLFFGGHKVIGWMAQRHPDSDLWRKASRILNLTTGNFNV